MHTTFIYYKYLTSLGSTPGMLNTMVCKYVNATQSELSQVRISQSTYHMTLYEFLCSMQLQTVLLTTSFPQVEDIQK
jgi:hypothetical protein